MRDSPRRIQIPAQPRKNSRFARADPHRGGPDVSRRAGMGGGGAWAPGHLGSREGIGRAAASAPLGRQNDRTALDPGSEVRNCGRADGAGPPLSAAFPHAKIERAMQFLHESLVELITQTATNLPPDVRAAMGVAIAGETPGTQAAQALGVIANNIDMAAD